MLRCNTKMVVGVSWLLPALGTAVRPVQQSGRGKDRIERRKERWSNGEAEVWVDVANKDER